jgi:hypothetical protein
MNHHIHLFASDRKVARDVSVTDCKISFARKIEKGVLNILVRSVAAPMPMWAPAEMLISKEISSSVLMAIAMSTRCSQTPGNICHPNAQLQPDGDQPFGLPHKSRQKATVRNSTTNDS